MSVDTLLLFQQRPRPDLDDQKAGVDPPMLLPLRMVTMRNLLTRMPSLQRPFWLKSKSKSTQQEIGSLFICGFGNLFAPYCRDVSALKEKTTIKREDVNLQELFSRLVSMMCIDVHPSAQSKLSQMLAGNTELRFDESDIANYRPTVKTMFLTSFQQAYSKKEAADKTDDFVERERLLQQASEVYLDCLERHTRNSFALHNFARVLLALAPFRSFNQEEEKQLVFIAKKMASVAEAENKHLKRAEIDLYQYNELYDEAGRPRKINPAKVWLRPETIQRLVLLRQEMEDSLNALNEAQDAADSEMVIELLSMLKESYISIFDELLDEADEQGSLINSVPRRAALYCWKLYVSVFPQNALAWERIVAELYSEGRIYITRDQWNALADELYGM